MEMVKAKMIVLCLLLSAFASHAQEYEWISQLMDGSRTGCVSVSGADVEEAIGKVAEDGTYYAPNGRIFQKGSSVAKVAALVHEAQPEMMRVKTVIGYSDEEMPTSKSESKLSNWFVGIVMDKVASLSGKKVDVGICNFGGIRVNMPAGEVILDDMLSMFPFKNDVVYLELKGSRLRNIFETMAADGFQAVGGVEIVVEDGVLTKALIGGEPIDDDKMYGVATISFLLYGGDSLTLADGAVNLTVYDVQIIEAVLEHVKSLTDAGKHITAPAVKYVTIK